MRQRLSVRLPVGHGDRIDFAERLASALGPAAQPWPVELEFGQAEVATLSMTARRQLGALRQRGVRIAIAGFGAGQTNLPALVGFAADRATLDPALLADVDVCERARIVAATLIQMLHALGCSAVAGPVDRQEQIEVLRAIGCDSVQGFFGAEPLAEQPFMDWVLGQDCTASLARVS